MVNAERVIQPIAMLFSSQLLIGFLIGHFEKKGE
jgi:hypothetical protein